MDLKLDTNGDLELGADDLVLVEDLDAIAQHLAIRFQFFRGDWFLDTRAGIPYYEQILRKAPDLNVVRSLFREVVLTTPGVLSINSFALDYELSTRTLSVSFGAITVLGELSFSEAFIVPRVAA